MADFSALKSTIQSYIKQNGHEEITGTILQDILLAMVQSLGDSAINGLVSDLASESTARQNADGTLTNSITAINNAISNGMVYAGIATPTGTPASGKVFYIALQAGTYTNFGNKTLTQGINILKYNGSSWTLEQVIGFDDYPTANSAKLVKSGGVDAEIKSLVGYYTCGTAAGTAEKTITSSTYILLQGGGIKVKFTNANTADDATLKIGSADAKPLYYSGRRAGSSNSWLAGEVVEIYYDGTNYYANSVAGGNGSGDGAFDISVYNAVNGTPAQYAGFAAAVTNANVPTQFRKGGMTVRFIDNTVTPSVYVQYRLMKTTWSTSIADWQGVDNVPTAGSENLVKSGGVARTKVEINTEGSKNILNPDDCVPGYRINISSGEAVPDGNFIISGFIPVSENGLHCNKAYYGGSNIGGAVYDADGIYIRGFQSSSYSYRAGEAYVRFTLSTLTEAQVEEGSSETPYVPFNPIAGYTAIHIADDVVTTDKLRNKNVTLEKLADEGVYLSSTGIYSNDVAELYLLNAVLADIDRVSLRSYGNSPDVLLKAFSGSSAVWTSRISIGSSWVDGVVYELKCTTAGGGVSVNDICGYIVFKDIVHFKANTKDADIYNINIERAKRLYLQTNISIAIFSKNAIIGTDNLNNEAVTSPKIAADSVTIDKTAYTEIEFGVNRLNTQDPDYVRQEGIYIKRSDGTVKTGATTSYGVTGYIPVSKNGLYFNGFILAGTSVGAAVYGSDKRYIRSTGNPYVYQEGDAYVRYSMKENPESPYQAGQFQVNEGSTGLPYEEFSSKKVLSPDVMPKTTLPEGSISYDMFDISVKSKLIETGVEVIIPDVVPVVLGDTLRVYWRSIIKAPNPYIYDIEVSGNALIQVYPRYFKFKPNKTGTSNNTIYVRNSNRDIIARKSFTLKVINAASSPASQTNILVIGASATANGNMAYELNRRLTTDSGSGTPANPTGLNLNNISFVGRKTGYNHPSIHLEATGGWGWNTYCRAGSESYRFNVTGASVINNGDTYRDANSNFVFTVLENNIDQGVGNIRCSFTGSGTLEASGTLTLIDGGGDLSITYTSFEIESANPFWNAEKAGGAGLDFINYANSYCNGSIDMIISHLGINDFQHYNTLDGMTDLFTDYIKPFVRAYHTDFPNGKFLFSTIPLGCAIGGVGSGAAAFLNYYKMAQYVWRLSELAHEMAADEEFSSYFIIADVTPSFDCENLYSTFESPVTLRDTAQVERIGSNGIHPIEIGGYTVADAIYESICDIL